jgi:hypothetical protein
MKAEIMRVENEIILHGEAVCINETNEGVSLTSLSVINVELPENCSANFRNHCDVNVISFLLFL